MSPDADKALACVILAAGKGTRMSSARAKVLHELLGLPMVSYPVLRAQELGAAPVVAVLGYQRAEVERALRARHGPGAVTVVEQPDPRGTGEAVRLGLGPLARWEGMVLILYGDVPLLRRETLEGLVAEARRTGGLAFLSARVADPTGYGRVVRDGRGRVARIVEHKDASEAERAIDEINVGIYAGPAGFLRAATAALETRNAQGEYYLVDVVEKAAAGIGASTVTVSLEEAAGINDRRQLAEAEAILRKRVIERWLAHATFRDPDSALVEADVVVGADAEIGRQVALRGRTRIGAGARIGDGAVLIDCDVGAGAEVGAHAVLVGVRVADGASVAPLTHRSGD